MDNQNTCYNCTMRCCPIRHNDKKCENYTIYRWQDRFDENK